MNMAGAIRCPLLMHRGRLLLTFFYNWALLLLFFTQHSLSGSAWWNWLFSSTNNDNLFTPMVVINLENSDSLVGKIFIINLLSTPPLFLAVLLLPFPPRFPNCPVLGRAVPFRLWSMAGALLGRIGWEWTLLEPPQHQTRWGWIGDIRGEKPNPERPLFGLESLAKLYSRWSRRKP